MKNNDVSGTEAPELQHLDLDAADKLLGWRPASGVFSAYVSLDHGDRGGRVRIELRDDLERAIGDDDAAEGDRARLTRTASRIEQAVEALSRDASGRGVIGFVEAARGGEERWFTTQLAPRRTEVHLGERATLAPLLALLEDGAPTGVGAVSGDRVRLFDWRLGQLEQLHDWELEVFSLDWRERKAPGPSNPATGSGASAAGHDQYQQRMDHNRDRFARETGELSRNEARDRGWRQILVFGDARHAGPFAEGLGDACPVFRADHADLAGQPTHLIAERVERAVPEVNRERQLAIVEGIKDAGLSGGRAALGPQETMQSLEEGRVERLVYDVELAGPEVERMIELAASTSADVTPVEEAAAAGLSEQDGVAAQLRY